MHAADPHSAESLMSRQEKDAELDRRIVALHKKNQALLRRYQEIQEDRRQAEQGGMAVTTPGLLQPDGLTVTISQHPGEKRVVSRNWVRSPVRPGVAGEMLEDEDEEDLTSTFRMGERVELAVTMENKARAKRIVSEKPSGARSQQADGPPGGSQGQSASTQTAIGSDSAQKAHLQDGTRDRNMMALGSPQRRPGTVHGGSRSRSRRTGPASPGTEMHRATGAARGTWTRPSPRHGIAASLGTRAAPGRAAEGVSGPTGRFSPCPGSLMEEVGVDKPADPRRQRQQPQAAKPGGRRG